MGEIELAMETILEHGVIIEAQLVLDHSVCDIARHLAIGHLVAGEIIPGEPGAVDTCGELVCIVGNLQASFLMVSIGRRLTTTLLVMGGDCGEVYHGVG